VIPKSLLGAGSMIMVTRHIEDTETPLFVPDAAVGHAFPDAQLAFDHAGTQKLALPVPRVAGMTELVLNRARAQFRGVSVELPDIGASSPSQSDRQALGLPVGAAASLVRIRVKNLQPHVDNNQSLALFDDAGAKSFRWSADDKGKVTLTRNGDVPSGTPRLHLMLSAGTSSGHFGPPAKAVPSFSMPNNSAGLYQPILAGVDLAFDKPSQGWLTLEVVPVDAQWIQIFLGAIAKDDVHGGMPNDATAVKWTADEIHGVWQTAPRDLTVAAAIGSSVTQVALLPSELSTTRFTTVDFTPAARSLLNAAYKKPGSDDLALEIDVTSKSAGQLKATGVGIDVEYRFAAVPKEGRKVALRGDPARVELPLPGPFRPTRFSLTLDGRFGVGALVQAADVDPPLLRSGFRVGGDAWAARRVELARDEINLRLLRVGLLGRATGVTELLVSIHRGDEAHIGAQLGPPVTIAVPPSQGGEWHRAELPDDPSLLPHPGGVWIVARASRGVFWWYGDPKGQAPTQLSPDAGASWTAITGRPLVQLHKKMRTPKVEPLTLTLDGRTLFADVTTAPATTRLVQVAPAQAAALPDDAATTASTLDVSPEDKTSATFRIEGLEPLPDADLAALKAKPSLVLGFASRRDVDFRVLDAQLTYDPWTSKEP
jgi:hypothetical protein